MSVYTTEIASDSIASDNPIHQRLLQAYHLSEVYTQGDVLEVGVGEGRGVGGSRVILGRSLEEPLRRFGTGIGDGWRNTAGTPSPRANPRAADTEMRMPVITFPSSIITLT